MMCFTLLDETDIIGNTQLEVMKKYGAICSPTDFAILLGASVSSHNFTNESFNLDERVGAWCLRTLYGDASMLIVNRDGIIGYTDLNNSRNLGIRPAVPYSDIAQYCTYKGPIITSTPNREKIKVVEYGEYPQMAVSIFLNDVLDIAFNKCEMKRTGKVYTTNYVGLLDFKPVQNFEYEYEGKKYIRIKASSYSRTNKFKLSNGVEYIEGDYVWIEIRPIEWLVDEKEDIAISKKSLFSGVRFKGNNCCSDFFETDIKKFMDTYFSEEIITDAMRKILDDQVRNGKKNPYNFDFDKVTEEEIIRGAVESNIAVFLHGRSSEGKSARVKQIDSDAEIIYLRNATPDSLNGKSVYNSATNEMIDIPPTWYKKLVRKCEEEPDKIHIVFFDEITNALPSIQRMAFNIVLDGEVNGIWKLPPNARIVAAGNDLEDSKAANEMAEPLFNRFAHVYINTTVDSWLKWASTPVEDYGRLDYKDEKIQRKIHPSIYAYIAYKSYSKQDVLRTEYNGKTPNADPRKWEMASKVLYSTGKPEMLRALIGESLTRDFIHFVKEQVLTVEDVINGNYTESDLEMSVSEKYTIAVGLSSVDEEHIEVVRNFVLKLGPEICAMFDTLWTHGDESRLEKIRELKMRDLEASQCRLSK